LSIEFVSFVCLRETDVTCRTNISQSLTFRRKRSCCYSCTFPRGLSDYRLSACHIHAPCWNRLTDSDAIWHVHLRGPMTHCVRWGSPAKTCNCKLQPSRQSYAASWRIQTRSWVNLPQRFRLLPNYFGPCFALCRSASVIAPVCCIIMFLSVRLSVSLSVLSSLC